MVALELFNFLHFVGLAFGLGGATIAAIISRKAEKDKELGKQVGKIFPSIINLIWVGLILLAISGIMLPSYAKWSLNKNLLLVKHVLVVFIILFGFILAFNSKKMMRLAQTKERGREKELLKVKKIIMIFSMINLFLWYLVTFLSVFV